MVSRHEIIMTNDTMTYNHNLGELQKETTVAKNATVQYFYEIKVLKV